MSLHYYDAGSGPHDTAPRESDGLRNCGCRHDGHAWISFCKAAQADHDLLRAVAQWETSGVAHVGT